MKLVDANVLLRFLLNDIPEQSDVARRAIESGAAVEIEVVAEVVYVLQRVYEVPRKEIAEVLGDLCPKLACSRMRWRPMASHPLTLWIASCLHLQRLSMRTF